MLTSTQPLFKDVEGKMQKGLDTLRREFSELRGGRATPALVEHITVDYYGTATPLKQLAAITSPEPSLLVIQPWDAKVAPEIERAILKASIGITPVMDGKVVRLPIPPLTGERRVELTKVVHKVAEESRIAMRNVRRDANEAVKKLKAEKQVSEDEAFKAQEQVQKLTDKYIGQIDSLVKSKEQELNTV
jgi:ribosome recycling factor